MEFEDLLIQQIIAVAGIAFWFLFPLGMFISVIRQNREALPPKKIKPFADYQLHPPYHEDPFAQVKIGDEKEFEEPKMDDFSQKHVTLGPGPDHRHTDITQT